MVFLVGPIIHDGDTILAVKLLQPLSLLCGTELMGNPAPSIEWFDPNNESVSNTFREELSNDDETGIRLNISDALEVDDGIWTCIIKVEATNVNLAPTGEVQSTVLVGQRISQIEVFIVG